MNLVRFQNKNGAWYLPLDRIIVGPVTLDDQGQARAVEVTFDHMHVEFLDGDARAFMAEYLRCLDEDAARQKAADDHRTTLYATFGSILPSLVGKQIGRAHV